MKLYKYILTVLYLLVLQAVLAQELYKSFYTLTDATSVWNSAVYERVARVSYKLSKGFRFTAADNGVLHAYLNENHLTDNSPVSELPEITDYDFDESRPVGVIPSSHAVSPTGAVLFNIPIEVAPGTQGVQPSLSANYNSHGGNGLLGTGWNLNGIMAITRCNPSLYYDGVTDSGEGSRFMMNGQRLLIWDGNYGKPNSSYETEIRSFADISAGGSGDYIEYFTVKTSDGMEYYYDGIGTTTIGEPFAWVLTKVTDKNGNYMTYRYFDDIENGEFWLDEIRYTGNENAGTKPYNRVKLFYEYREDQKTAYFLGKRKQSVVLAKVIVEAEGQLAWSYDFTYHYNSGYGRGQSTSYRLIQIDKTDQNGVAMNPIRIDWEHAYVDDVMDVAVMDFNININANNSYKKGGSTDLNGDGTSDIYYMIDSYLNIKFSISGEESAFRNTSVYIDPAWGEVKKMATGYFTSRKSKQILLVLSEKMLIYDVSSQWPSKVYEKPDPYTDNHNRVCVGDFDGDGYDDIFTATESWYGFIQYVKKGKRTYNSEDSNWRDLYDNSDINQIFTVNFDGDNKADILVRCDNKTYIFELDEEPFKHNLLFETNTITSDEKILFGDFNGDGKTDLLVWSDIPEDGTNNWSVHTSTGSGFEASEAPSGLTQEDPDADAYNNNVLCVDLNSDGMTDIFNISVSGIYPNKYHYIDLFYSKGAGFTNDGRAFNIGRDLDDNNFVFKYGAFIALSYVGDYNGDGLVDILCANDGSIFYFDCIVEEQSAKYYMNKFDYVVNGFNDGLEYTFYNYSSTGGRITPEDLGNGYKRCASLPLIRADYCEDNSGTTNYTFSNAVFHQDKGFLGFENINSTLQKDGLTVTTEKTFALDQNFCFMYPSESRLTADKDGISNVKTVSWEMSTPVYGTQYSSSANSKIISVYQEKEIVTETNLPVRETRTVKSNSYGNLTNVTGYINGALTSQTDYYYNNLAIGHFYKFYQKSTRKYRTETTHSTVTENITYSGNNISSISISVASTENELGDGSAGTTTFEDYDHFGNAKKKTVNRNGNLRSSIIAFDDYGRWPKTATNFRGETALYEYDPRWGAKTKVTDNWGRSISYTYSDFGKLVKEKTPIGETVYSIDWDLDSGPENTSMFYTLATNSNGTSEKSWFDIKGRPVQTVQNNMVKVDVIYDETNSMKKVSLPYTDAPSVYKEYTFDVKGRVVKEFNGLSTINYTYADNASFSLVTIKDENKDYSVIKQYNERGQLEQAKDFGSIIYYDYYSNGLLKSSKVNSVTTSFKYDVYGNRTEMNDPSAGVASTTYDVWGNVETQSTPTTDMSYSYYQSGAFNGYLKTATENGTTATYEYYNETSLLKSVTNTNGTSELYTYDNDLRQVTAKTMTIPGYSSPLTHEYSYNPSNGRLETETYASGFAIAYDYDGYGRLKALYNQQTSELIYEAERDDLGFVTAETHGYIAPFSVEKTYDQLGRITSITDWDSEIAYDYSYETGTNNLSKFRNKTIGNMGWYLTQQYSYENDRLTGYDSETFEYDKQGNMTYNSYLGDADENGENMYYDNGTDPYQLTSMTVTDPDIATLPVHNVTFNGIDRAELIEENGYDISFLYGSDRERRKMEIVKDDVPYMTKYYFGATEIQEDKVGKKRVIDYIGIGSGLLAMHVMHPDGDADGEIIHCVTDRLGSPVKLISDDGTQLAEYSYDPWGRMRNPSTLQAYKPGEITWASLEENGYPSWFHRGYTGHEMLFGVNLINMNARLYDPITCRFLSPDNYVQAPEFSQNFNRYMYGYNNPLMYSDPTGNMTWVGALVSTLISAAGVAVGVLTAGAIGFVGYWDDETGDWQIYAGGWTTIGTTPAAGIINFGVTDGEFSFFGGFAATPQWNSKKNMPSDNDFSGTSVLSSPSDKSVDSDLVAESSPNSSTSSSVAPTRKGEYTLDLKGFTNIEFFNSDGDILATFERGTNRYGIESVILRYNGAIPSFHDWGWNKVEHTFTINRQFHSYNNFGTEPLDPTKIYIRYYEQTPYGKSTEYSYGWISNCQPDPYDVFENSSSIQELFYKWNLFK